MPSGGCRKKEHLAAAPRGALFLCFQPEAAAVEFQQALPLHPPQLPGQGAAVDAQHLRHLLPGIGEMAEVLGVNRSALSRELGRMQREGLLEFYRSSFRLKA